MAEGTSGKKPGLFIAVILIAALIGGGAYFMNTLETSKIAPAVSNNSDENAQMEAIAQELDASVEAATTNTPQTPEVEVTTAEDLGIVSAANALSSSFDLETALSVRALGDPNAPVTIHEFSSFTCSHCGSFHKTTFDQIVKNYVDTGKVYMVFNDFPLNAEALHAGMIARCLPQERYFGFIDYLFKNQGQWNTQDYLQKLQANAALAGLSRAQFQACMSNEDLQNGILTKMSEAQKKYNIRSTPTFVVNEKVVSGAFPYAAFSQMIDAALEQVNSDATESETPKTE